MNVTERRLDSYLSGSGDVEDRVSAPCTSSLACASPEPSVMASQETTSSNESMTRSDDATSSPRFDLGITVEPTDDDTQNSTTANSHSAQYSCDLPGSSSYSILFESGSSTSLGDLDIRTASVPPNAVRSGGNVAAGNSSCEWEASCEELNHVETARSRLTPVNQAIVTSHDESPPPASVTIVSSAFSMSICKLSWLCHQLIIQPVCIS